MNKQKVLIAELEQRLDVILAGTHGIGSRNQAQKAIRAGRVTVEDKVVYRPSHKVMRGSTIKWHTPIIEPMRLVPQSLPLDIIYEDQSLLVINKPARMPVHPGAGRPIGTLVNALLHHVQSDLPSDPNEPFRPGIVHRLDMDTTGLLVVAKNDVAHRALQSQFEARSVRRHYVGIVWGIPEPRSGIIEAPIGRSARNRTLMSVRPNGRSAFTRYETHEILGPAALVRFQLGTGRTHQIRVHSRHIGHPLIGDVAYGGTTIMHGSATRKRRVFYANIFAVLQRQALHAKSLGFHHPDSGAPMQFTSELPEDMIWTMEQLPKDSTYFRKPDTKVL